MSKRFTATTKWTDPWFCSLSERNRLFWIFLLDNCDHAGIWKANWMLVEVYFPGFGRDLSSFENRIIRLNDEKWFIPKFLEFQYGNLNPVNRLHYAVLLILKKEGLSMDLISPIQGAKDKDKEEESLKLLSTKATKQPDISKPAEPKKETDIQKIVKVWKLLNSIPTEGPESKAWDQVHFPRHAKSANSLLTLFGDWEKASEAMEYVYMTMTAKKLACSIETTVKHSDLYREYQARGSFK